MKYKQARWREASRDIDVVTITRSMYIVQPKDPYFSPNPQILVLLFISFAMPHPIVTKHQPFI